MLATLLFVSTLYMIQQNKLSVSYLINICTGGATRTPDTWFWRPVLYQLSYTRLRKKVSPNKGLTFNINVYIYCCKLFDNFSYLSCTYSTTTFTNSETKTFIHSNRSDKLNSDSYIITRHYHLSAFWKKNFTGYIKCT